MEIRHAATALSVWENYGSGINHPFHNARIVYCATGFHAADGTDSYYTMGVTNACFNNVATHYSSTAIAHYADSTCANNPPTISDVQNVSIDEDSVASGSQSFTVKDVETPANITNASFTIEPVPKPHIFI